jgi:hypothetical protein
MAELTISSDEIRGALERYVSSYTPEISREEVGVVPLTASPRSRVSPRRRPTNCSSSRTAR